MGDVLQPAIQNLAQLVQRIGADVPVFAQTVQLARAEVILFDQFILRYASIFHCFPEWFKRNHTKYHPIHYTN